MKRKWFTASLQPAAVVLLLLLSDCDQSDSNPKPRPTVPGGAGIVHGSVKFSAPKPVVTLIVGECCPGAAASFEETTVVNDNGTLRNVLVYIKSGPNVETDPGPPTPATLDQKDCRYSPHVVAIRTGQPIDVTSHDPTMHNVNVMASINPATNFSETAVGAAHRLTFANPEFIHIKCDVHPWMSAYICVLDHPFFAVTDDQGKFEIPHLPAGAYTLVAWHERYGTLEQPITITAATPAEINFDYKPNDTRK